MVTTQKDIGASQEEIQAALNGEGPAEETQAAPEQAQAKDGAGTPHKPDAAEKKTNEQVIADLQEQLRQAQERATKAETDQRSRNLSTLDRSQQAQKLTKIERMLEVVVENSDDPKLKEKTKAIQVELDATERSAEAQEFQQSSYQEIVQKTIALGLAKDEASAVEVIQNHADFANLRLFWRGATGPKGDSSFFRDAVHEMTLIENNLLKKRLKDKDQETEARIKKLKTDFNLEDLSTGPEAGGEREPITWSRAQKIKKVSELSDAAYEKLIAKPSR